MVVLRNVLRIYSYIFEGILCLMAIAVSAVTLLSGNEDLQLGWLPWTGHRLPVWLFSLGLLGLVCILLAGVSKLRVLLFLFSLVAFVLLARGFFYSSYRFAAEGEFRRALLLLAGAFLATIGAWPMSTGSRIKPRVR
ncbi:MAG: hypothetical protein M3Z23_15130 [Acidobacteriota bacterium]|nr:hypothetical protein [Acidobacteriota bacterium]